MVGVDFFSDGREPIELTASPVPAARTTIRIAERYSVLMAMPSLHRPMKTNRAVLEMVPSAVRFLVRMERRVAIRGQRNETPAKALERHETAARR